MSGYGAPDFRAGAMAGGKAMIPQEETVKREVEVPTCMTKTLIFVVDLSTATRTDGDPKLLNELQEDLVDAMGV